MFRPVRRRAMLPASLLMFLLMVVAGCDSSDPRDEERLRALDFILSDLDGNSFQLSSTEGKVVALHFFAPWCPTCQAEAPTINGVYNMLLDANRDIEIIGVAMDADSVGQIRAYRDTYEVPYPILIDNGNVSAAYGVLAFPTTYFIDEEAYLYGPYPAMEEAEWTNLFNSLLND